MTSDTLELQKIISTSLEPLLGYYKFSNGQTTPAILVTKDNGEKELPDGTKIFGLEAIIQTPSLSPTPMLRGHKVRKEWTLYLKQWEKGKDPRQAVEKLLLADLEEFIIERIIPIPADYKIGVPLGATIRIYAYELLEGL